MDAHATHRQPQSILTGLLFAFLLLASDNLENELASESCVSRETFGEGVLLFELWFATPPLLPDGILKV